MRPLSRLAQLVYLNHTSSLLASRPAPRPNPRVQVRKHGKQKNLFISLGLLPKAPPEPGLLKPEHTASPKGDSESGLPCSWGGADEQVCSVCPPTFLLSVHL